MSSTLKTGSLWCLAATCVFAVGLGCGDGGGDGGYSGRLSVTLVDGPSPLYSAVNLEIESVQIHRSGEGEAGWITVSTPHKVVDLLRLRGGVVEALADEQTLPAGQYQMLRLVLGSHNTLTLADSTTVPLEVPSGMGSGVKVPLSFEVHSGTTADVWIDFDAAHSIQVVGTGSGKYILRPVVRGMVKVATGSISGTVGGPGGLALPGALVLAESVSASGDVTLWRSTHAGLGGTYTLDLLPLDQPIFVVTQPVVAGVVYDAQASAPQVLSQAVPTSQADLQVLKAVATGGVQGHVAPVAGAGQSDVVYLMRALNTGNSASTRLMVSSMNAVLGPTSENYLFGVVPTADYHAQALRTTVDGQGNVSLQRSPISAAVTVSALQVATQDLTF